MKRIIRSQLTVVKLKFLSSSQFALPDPGGESLLGLTFDEVIRHVVNHEMFLVESFQFVLAFLEVRGSVADHLTIAALPAEKVRGPHMGKYFGLDLL